MTFVTSVLVKAFWFNLVVDPFLILFVDVLFARSLGVSIILADASLKVNLLLLVLFGVVGV